MARRDARTVPRTFLFADLRGYTAYVERAGDAAAARLLRGYRDLVRREVARERGAEVKTEGDSFYVVFDSTAAAVRCAVAIQRAAARRRGEPLAVGIGLHVGEAIPFEAQFVGSAVNVAARLASAAEAGEILLSDTVRQLIRTALRVPLEDRGTIALKGLAEPVRAFGIRAHAGPSRPPDAAPPAGAMSALARGDLDESVRLVQRVPGGAPAEARCDALAALTILAAGRGDLDTALGRTEQLLRAALRAADRSWLCVTYALRAWLYCLARQPAEGRAELARAFERPAASPEACLALLLATTLGGSRDDAERLRRIALACPEPGARLAGAAVADALESPSEAPLPPALAAAGGPLMGRLLEIQLTARIHGRLPADRPDAARPWPSERLLQFVRAAVQ